MKINFSLSVLLLCCTGFLLSQDDPYYVTQLDQSIEFDGWVNESVWKKIKPFDLKMVVPIEGGEPTEMSEIRIAYDENYIYLSGILNDRSPEKIMANTKKRDALNGSTQWFGFVIDSYNDNENALAFFTTPTGLRLDLAVFGDAISRNPVNISWNTFWDAKVQKDENGWQSELRVPFSSLAFENQEEVTMGITTWRYIARKSETDMYPLIPQNYGDWSNFKPSLAKDMIFKNIVSQKPFYITPYALSGFSNSNDLNDPETAYINEKSFLKELGVDVKYGISKNWILDLSVNTDFAQVEADDQQVNLTRFSLFFPEKRLFFQERAGIFNFGFGGGANLFYSRRIGLNEDNEPIRIYGGSRIVGRSGSWDIGFLSMQTADDADFQGENLSVFRAKRDIINDYSDAGFMITNRTNFNGGYNTTYGIDAVIKVFLEDYLDIKWATTLSDQNEKNNIFSLDPSRLWLALYTRRQFGFGYGTSFSRAGKDYNPSLGFEQREDYTRLGNRVQYGWLPSAESIIYRHAISSRGSAHWKNDTGKLESLGYRLSWEMTSKNAWGGEIGIGKNVENLIEEFELSDDIIIPVGDYNYSNFYFEGFTTQSRSLWTAFEFSHGSFYDGQRTSIRIDPTYNISSSLELSMAYQFNRLTFDNRDQKADLHLIRMKALYMIDTKLSIAALMQYNSQDKNFAGNVRFRYNPSEGNDLYIVYNDNINTDLMRETPHLPRNNNRNIVVKYSYTFRL